MRIAIAVLLLALAVPAFGGTVQHVYLGVGGLWQDGNATTVPNALEAGGSASLSVSPHISLVGDTFFGLSQSYARYSGGVRYSVTDARNPDFNSFIGIRYRGGSVAALGPNEWAPDAGLGWRPFPSGKLDRLLVVAVAGYGLTSTKMLLTGGLRWEVPLK